MNVRSEPLSSRATPTAVSFALLHLGDGDSGTRTLGFELNLVADLYPLEPSRDPARGRPSSCSRFPSRAAFTPDGKYLLVGNYLDSDFSILKVNGSEIVYTGKRFKVPGHPVSARISAR